MSSADCCFLHVFYIAGNHYQMESKRSKTFCGSFWTKREPMGRISTLGLLRGEHNSRRALVGCAHLGCPRIASLLYKYPNILETLGESTKINSSRRRVQNHQIQSRHHHGGFPTSIGASSMMHE